MLESFIVPLLAATVQSGTPILYATLGEILTEKGGVLNLGVEGMMSMAAFVAFFVSYTTGNPWLGFVCGGLAGSMMAMLHGFVCITCLGNQVVSGLALTILGVGLCHFLGTPYIGMSAAGFHKFSIPFISSIPYIGKIFFRQDTLVYVSYFIPLLLMLFINRTSMGLAITAVGEKPAAAAAAGLKAVRLRWMALLGGGFLIGLGGAYLSLAYTHLWANGLAGGRGWIAVALVIFAFWRPGRAVFGAYLFGGVMAFQLRLQAIGTHIPSSLLLMLPYALTILVLVFSAIRGRGGNSPAHLGINIEPEG
ncbi:simple sugar transport system permease protein [Maridesulfovibrio ferrireducens]|uniref:Simple sugar transport system permease protein n=1 Tax=Maridesulfovibrio ferrireducens TaxID=246191 RepID=A0A1G9HGY6_9BACT|nr:ABC transporter permease [Maridesulfovibrio ferrireducens]SDL12165.1 simple sugar transport system permease protein [Maridesulfovibrio ferrireducens]